MAGRNHRLDRLNRLNAFHYPQKKTRPPSPREEASFIQVLFMSWLIPLLKIGMKRELSEHDLYPVLYEDQADRIADHLEILWGDHVEDCKIKDKKPSLLRVLLKTYTKKFIFFGLFSLAEEAVFRMIQVASIGYILDYFGGNYLTTFAGTIYFGVGGIIAGSLAFLISFHWSIFNMHHVCCHIRIGLSSLVYRKLLHLNHASLRDSTVGHLVTMIASDLHRFDRKHIQVNYIWIAPIHLFVVVYILYFHFQFGAISLVGLVVLVFFTIIQYLVGKKFLKMRQKRVDSSDFRIRAVVEIINAFYTIKVQCWEKFFSDKAMDNRKTEIKILRSTMFFRLLNSAIGFIVTKTSVFMTLLFAFLFPSDEHNYMNAKRVFVTLILYEHVRVNSVLLFPTAVHDVAELICSVRRIEAFLLAEELELPNQGAEADTLAKQIGPEKDREPKIVVSNLNCKWISDDFFGLKDISFQANKGELFCIAGPVGSGKTTLISAILGEIPPSEGHILVIGRIAYVPQEPVLFPGTIKRNIIFGYGINHKWYEDVIHMCELHQDFKTFPKGDQSLTETTRLTTAQRMRINLARAIYANADIFVLDDPLQSMDLKHYKHFVDVVLHKALADKVVILVTHQVQILEAAEQVMLMYDGKIFKRGTVKELKAEGIEFHWDVNEDNNEFDEEYSDEEIVLTEEENAAIALLMQDDFNPVMKKAKELKRQGSIHFEVDEHDNTIKKITQHTTNELRHRKSSVRRGTGTGTGSMSAGGGAGANGEGGQLGEGDMAIAHIAVMVNDGSAYDAKDTVSQPKRISLRLYYDFLKTGSSTMVLIFLFLTCLISQTIYTFTDYWIEHWADEEEHALKHGKVFSGSKRRDTIIVYCALISSIVIITLGRSIMIFTICIKASTAIFVSLLDATIKAKLHFFEKTSAGHAINRLAKDMVIIDDLIPPTLLEVLAAFFEILGALVLVSYANPWFIIPCVAFFCTNLFVYRVYHLTAVDLKRMERNARTPVYTHLNKTLQGVTTIRAFGQEQAFVMIFDRLQDNHTASWYLFLSTQAWLAIIIDFVSVLMIGAITVSFFYLNPKHTKISESIVGLTISKIIELSILVQFAAQEMSNVETQMISVERVLEFASPEEKNVFEDFDGHSPPIHWPSRGKIEFIDVSLVPPIFHKRRKSLRDPKTMDLTIEAGEWIGVVGKAGSGKTSLLNTLFRIATVDTGQILIDGVDISTIGLHHLREKISLLPQTPCMFRGTIRENLDPLNKCTDDQIWKALEECTLFDTISKLENGLNSSVTEFGMNFSAGQRQFICFARAILENNKIICCDEPTACLDGFSQMIMLHKLKEHFGLCTVIFVAHRIDTIGYFDRVIVLDAGQLVDEGTPLELLGRKNGPFYDLVQHLGDGNIKALIDKIQTAGPRGSHARRSSRRKSHSGKTRTASDMLVKPKDK